MIWDWLIKPTIVGMPWGIGFMSGAFVGYEPLTISFWLVVIAASFVSTVVEKLVEPLA